MIDSRLTQARAAIDDARTLLADIDEESPNISLHEYNLLAAARQFLNSSLTYVTQLETT